MTTRMAVLGSKCPIVLVIAVWISTTVVAKEPPVTALAFAPNGQSVVASSQSGVREFAWPDLTIARPLVVSVKDPRSLAFSPDGTRLAIAGGAPAEEGVCQILAWPEGKPIGLINEHEDAITSVVWLDDVRVACGSLDHDITISDSDSGTVLHRLKGHSRGVTAIERIATTGSLVSTGSDQSLRVWDMATGDLQRSLNQHTQTVHDLAVRPNQTGLPIIASASDDKTVRLWQPTIGRMMRFVRLRSRPLAIAWSNDGAALLASCTDGTLHVINPELVRVDAVRNVIDGWAYVLAAHPKSGEFLVGGEGGRMVSVSAKQALLGQD